MTMDEITGLFDDLDRAYYAERCDSYQAARAALLRAVEGITRERDESRNALHGTSQFVGPCPHGSDPWTRCDECEGRTSVQVLLARAAAADEMVAASNEELMRLRAMLSVERDASEGSRRYAKECHAAAATLNDERASAIRRAEAAESALAAMRREVEDRRDRWLSADPAPSPFDAGTLRLAGTELRLMLARLAASPPPAALSTETGTAPAENVRAACGHITADRGAHPLRCDVCAPTPTKSKEDPKP